MRWEVEPSVRGVLAGALAVVIALAAHTVQADPLAEFYGRFDGHAILQTDGLVEKRDLDVEIRKTEHGFSVRWVVVSYKGSGRVKRKEYEIDFRPSGRDKLYRSAMRTDVFGQAVPLDPIKGDPYFWARVDGKTLTVHALIINESGGYEVQTYQRTVIDGGLDLEYSRVSNGEVARTVKAQLRRIQ